MLKNKFIQKEFGGCLFYCLANLFNEEEIISLGRGKEGGYHMDARNIIEDRIKYHTLTAWNKRTLIEDPIERTDIFDNLSNFDGYCVLLITIESDTKGYFHQLLGFVDGQTGELIVLDPRQLHSTTFKNPIDILKWRKVYEIEAITDKVKGSIMSFGKNYFSHLQVIDEEVEVID